MENPSLLNRFLLLSYGDLKKYRFHYLFGFPALNFPEPLKATDNVPLFTMFNEEQRKQLQESYEELRGYSDDSTNRTDEFAFLIIRNGDNITTLKLCEWEKAIDNSDEILIGMSDPSGVDGHAGWPTRNLCILIAVQMKSLLERNNNTIRIAFLRQWRKEFDESSFVSTIPISPSSLDSKVPHSVGWEKDSKQKTRPKYIELSSTMDPEQLAASQTSLNLQLMKVIIRLIKIYIMKY